jgi:molybdopterin synthase catalytic subunit
MGSARLVDQPIDVAALIAAARRSDAGALAIFIGAVRDHADGKKVSAIDYSAYAPMATKVLQNIAQECSELWPGVELFCEHRIGHLKVGDDAVVIVASSAHRAEAFAACRHAIERIKDDCPIWKKEWGEDGASWVSPRP